MRPRTLIAYVVLVDLAALAAFAFSPWAGVSENPGTVVLLAFLAALAGSRPVMLPRLRTEVSASDAFGLCALAAFGSVAAGVVAFASVIGATLGERKRPSLVRLAFNLGAVPLAMLCAGAAFWAARGVPGTPVRHTVFALALAGVVYFLLNTALVAGAISLARGQGFRAAWGHSLLWTGAASITGISVAALLLLVLETVGPWALLIGVPPAWILTLFFRTNRETIVERDDRIETVEHENADLEQEVAQRTRSLQEVLTHLEAMNRQLRESNDRLVEADRIKNEFLANVSHELRTPLNAVIGFSELLGDPGYGSLSSEQREFLADIHDSGEHLLHLINNILDLAKIDAGRLEVKRTASKLPELFQTAAAMLKTQAAAKEIELSVCIGEGLETAHIDEGMTREIVANLLSNAVKFTGAGGRVGLNARRDGCDLRVEVRDTGIGIRSEDQEKIFEAFFQVDGSYSRTYQGTGLGLALVAQMMALHGGRVSVESELGVGSCFTCIFPGCLDEAPQALATVAPAVVTPPAVRAVEMPVAQENGSPVLSCVEGPVASFVEKPALSYVEGGRRRILLVEDNELNRKLARNALRSRGHEVFEAHSGEEAVALVSKHRPHLVLMDLQLPGMDGLEATRRIKDDPANVNLPVVALTAHVQALDESRARAAGCDGYITKPIRLTAFPSQVELFFDRAEVPV